MRSLSKVICWGHAGNSMANVGVLNNEFTIVFLMKLLLSWTVASSFFKSSIAIVLNNSFFSYKNFNYRYLGQQHYQVLKFY